MDIGDYLVKVMENMMLKIERKEKRRKEEVISWNNHIQFHDDRQINMDYTTKSSKIKDPFVLDLKKYFLLTNL